jgi:predicted kinase
MFSALTRHNGAPPSRHDWAMDRLTHRSKLLVTIGLPGSGKTTRAKELAAEFGAIRLTPDDWMIPLFNHNDAHGKRDVLEGRFIWLAMRALPSGVNVVLDFGVWGRDERSALKYLASKVGAECVLVYTPIDPDEQMRRVDQRFATAPDTTFVMTEADLAQWRSQFQEPDETELLSPEPGRLPADFASWEAWTVSRWPTALDPPPGSAE